MGKSSKASFSSGTVNVNGQTKASTYKRGKNVVTDYYMSPDEKRAYEYAQKSFADNLPQLNVFDENTQKNLQNQLNAYTAQGQKAINNMYKPMLENLKTDIASRFGNFDNSVFMDNLNNIESKRSDSMSTLAEGIMAKQSELVNDELSRRYNYMNFLQDIQNQANSNIFNFGGMSQANSSAGTSFSNANTSRKSTDYMDEILRAASIASAFM